MFDTKSLPIDSKGCSGNRWLLADPDHAVAEKYGAWRERNMYGKKSMGIQRSTYLIDADGKVVNVWQRVQVDGHDNAVIDALKILNASST